MQTGWIDAALAALDSWHQAGYEVDELVAEYRSDAFWVLDNLGRVATLLARENYVIWHAEDWCRTSDDLVVARYKRIIDEHNQARNDTIRMLDGALYEGTTQNRDAQAVSETPGSICDRIIINRLKLLHARELNVGGRHRAQIERLNFQEEFLLKCHAELWADVSAGRRQFVPFDQFKLYNSAETNPKLFK